MIFITQRRIPMKHTIILRVAALAMAASLAPTYATRLKDIDNANNSANKYIAEINDGLRILGPDLANAGVTLELVNNEGKKGYSGTLRNKIATLTAAVAALKAKLEVALINADTRIYKLKKLNELQAELAAKQAELAEQESVKQTSHSSSSHSRGSRGRR
jgi:hypothetical protein